MAKFSKGQTVVHDFQGTGEITKVETKAGKQHLTIKFANKKKMTLLGDMVKFPTEVEGPLPVGGDKPTKATKTKSKVAFEKPTVPLPEGAELVGFAEEKAPEPEPEVDETLKQREEYQKRVEEAMAKGKTANDANILSLIESDEEVFTQAMTSKDLKEMLKDRGVGSSGNKDKLVSRLRRHLEKKTRRGAVTPEVTVDAPDWVMPKLDAATSRQAIAKELSGFNKAQLIALADKAGLDITGSVKDLKERLMPDYKHVDKMSLDEMKFELTSEGVTGGQLTGRKTQIKRLLTRKWKDGGFTKEHLNTPLAEDAPASEILARAAENRARGSTPKKAKQLEARAEKIRSAANKKKARARAAARAKARKAEEADEEEEEEPVSIVEPAPAAEPKQVGPKAGYPAWWEKVWAETTADGENIDPEEFFTTQNMADFAKRAMLPEGERGYKEITTPSECKNYKYSDLSDRGRNWLDKWGRGLCTWAAGATLQVKPRQKKYTQLTPEGKVKRETPVETAKQMRACRDMLWEMRDVLAPSACAYRAKVGKGAKGKA